MRFLASPSASSVAIAAVVVSALLPWQCSSSPSDDDVPPRRDDRAGGGDDGGDVVVVVVADLDGLSDGELAGICSSRGFELSPPHGADAYAYAYGEGSPEAGIRYRAREDLVAAALECLRIEYDM